MADEARYLQLLRDVSENGETRPDRTGTGTKAIFAPDPLRFDIANTVPLYTTKKVPWKSIVKELLWFIRGQTDAKLLKEQNVHIWDGNTSTEFLRQRGLDYREGILGPGYGWQWRRFGAPYEENLANLPRQSGNTLESGMDQLSYIENLLIHDKYSRRIYLNAWNASDLDKMALVPCHVACQFHVDVQDGLSCHVYMRSNDLFLGNPFNVFSYAVLTYILAKRCALKPKQLIVSFGDAHLYLDHMTQVSEQSSRTPYPPPRLEVSDRVKEIDWSEIELSDFNLHDYAHHPPLVARMSI